MASLHHPNIIRVQSYGFDSELGPYYTMELLASSQTIVQAAFNRPLREKILLIVQLLHAILYLHRRGVLHRDIKPSNVLVAREEVKVLDFGIAVAAAKYAETAGTLEYMAPELLCGRPPSLASDLYAVGVVAHQILMGQFPFNRESTTKMLADLLGPAAEMTLPLDISSLIAGSSRELKDLARSAPSDPEEEGTGKVVAVESPIGDVIMRLLARQPEDRYGDSTEVLRDLSAALGESLPLETAKTRESFLQAAEFVGRCPGKPNPD